MTLTEFVSACKSFAPGDGATFSALLSSGLPLLGRSQREFASMIGMMPSTVSRWTAGSVVPHPQTQLAVVRKLQRVAGRMAAAPVERVGRSTGSPAPIAFAAKAGK